VVEQKSRRDKGLVPAVLLSMKLANERMRIWAVILKKELEDKISFSNLIGKFVVVEVTFWTQSFFHCSCAVPKGLPKITENPLYKG